MIVESATLTDDPVRFSSSIVSLNVGTEVTYLATYDDLAYIETTVSKKTVRGFIPRSSIIVAAGERLSPTEVNASVWLSTKQEPDSYTPQKAVDGQNITSWQVRLSRIGDITDAYFDYILPRPASVTTLHIKNGFWKKNGNKDQYTRNSRVKTVEISFRYQNSDEFTDSMTVNLPETTDWAKRNAGVLIDISRHHQVEAIRLRLMDYYVGTAFPDDVCISEIEVYGN